MSRTLFLPLVLASALSAVGCSDAPAPGAEFAPRPVNVLVEPLNYEYARTRVDAVGTSRARLSAELYPATSGEVDAIDFEPGQFVSKGNTLVQLDDRQEKLALELAQVQLADAKRLFDRYDRSAQSGAVLQTVLDEARTAVQTARLEVERAQIALDDRTVRAVFDGHVGATEVDPGDRIGPDTLITTLDDRSSLLVRFDIPELFIGELQVGDEVRLETWSANMPEVAGEIVDIGSRIDPQNRTFVARARVANDDDRLRPGMSFRVRVDVQGALHAVVNETALQWGADGAYIWSVINGVATRVAVEVIERRQGRVLIDGPLHQGDIIVVEGTHRMRDGVPVSFDESRFAGDRDAVPATAVSAGGRPDAAWD